MLPVLKRVCKNWRKQLYFHERVLLKKKLYQIYNSKQNFEKDFDLLLIADENNSNFVKLIDVLLSTLVKRNIFVAFG